MLNRREGFTLVEMMLVIIIIGILGAIAIPRFASARRLAQINACNSNVYNINSVWELQHIEHPDPDDDDGYTTLDELFDPTADIDVDGTAEAYFPDGMPTCAYDGTAYADADVPLDYRVDFHSH